MLGSMLVDSETTPERTPSLPTDDLLDDLLQAAGVESAESDERQRSRSVDKSAVTIDSASPAHRGLNPIAGHLRDAGRGGVGTLSTRPPAVGDVYLLTIPDSPFNTEQIFARCMHCRLIREDAFESGFAFFAPAALREE